MPVPVPPSVPSHAQVLIIGGGPAGSYCASVLAQDGIQVVVLEAARFPRYHIGESMLPSLRPFLRFIGAEEKVKSHGFTVKPGAAFKFNQYKREGYTDFVGLDPNNGAWNVIRSEFDEILLDHAAESGANVFQEHRVDEIHFKPGTESRPTHADFTGPNGKSTISFDYLVDASGRRGIMSTKYLKNRHMNQSLKNIACWGYWKGGKTYMPGTNRNNAPWFEALTDECGWSWYIPLHDGTVSVGFVMDIATSSQKKREAGPGHTLKDHYVSQLAFTPALKDLLENASLVEDGTKPSVQSTSDYSYSATKYSGDHYRLVGDASAFIDPFFSSGVHLALSGGLTAAASTAASLRGHVPETAAACFHNTKVGTSYTRFMLTVMGAYKQMTHQSRPVLTDINSDNFDSAFAIMKPIIQGAADIQSRHKANEIERTMDFVKHVLTTPTTPEMIDRVKEKVGGEYLDVKSRIMLEEEVEAMSNDEEVRDVLREANARKVIHGMYHGPSYLISESVDGLAMNVERGSLGLKLVGTAAA